MADPTDPDTTTAGQYELADAQAVPPLFYENPVEGGHEPADDGAILVQPCVRAAISGCYAEGHAAGNRARFERCKEDIARALGQGTGSALPGWDAMVASVRVMAKERKPHPADVGYERGYEQQVLGAVEALGRAHVQGLLDGVAEAQAEAPRCAAQDSVDGTPQAQVPGTPCCERDHDGDGNCDRHPAGGFHTGGPVPRGTPMPAGIPTIGNPAPSTVTPAQQVRLRAEDSVDGTDRPPARYTQGGRETIDVQRDRAWVVAVEVLEATGWGERVPGWPYATVQVASVAALATALFAYHCDATADKYGARDGHKGDREGDERKARFYRLMALHVRGDGPDPRHQRPDFKPYSRHPWGAR